MRNSNRQSGFTILEAVLSLVILGFITVGLMTLMGYATLGYVEVRNTADVAGKAQVAMDRLRLEFENMQSLTSVTTGANPNSVIYVDRNGISRTLAIDAQNSSRLMLGGNVLIDQVAAFTAVRTCGNQDGFSGGANDLASISVTVTMQGGIPPYTLTVYPRRILGCP